MFVVNFVQATKKLTLLSVLIPQLQYTAFDGHEINFRRDALHGARQCCVYQVILSFKGFNPCFCTCTVLRLLNIMFLRLFFRVSNEHPDRRNHHYASFVLILPVASLKFNWVLIGIGIFLYIAFLHFIVYPRQFILIRNPRVLYKLP